MTLDEIGTLESFALLGPGFGDGPFLLMRGLRDRPALPGRPGSDAASPGGATARAARRNPLRLVFCPYESSGREARVLEAAQVSRWCLDADPAAASPAFRFAEDGIREAVGTIRDAIAAGDVYQVCFTIRAPIGPASGASLFTAMCAQGVPRYAAWVRLPGGPEFVSASPECFFEVRGRSVRSEPMKGTARPGEGPFLESSAKDVCELAMITDLVRNDLARVCRPQSVRVPCARRMLVLPYALQAVSDVEGALRDDAGPLDVLDVLHPGGSVTGAPKQAARTLIGRLETTPRGAYCGALGLLGDDRATFSLLIRTASRTSDGWEFGVGSGIVWDSDADAEVDEFRTKLGALGWHAPP